MDKMTDDDFDGDRKKMTPLEHLKRRHQALREQIAYGDVDELDWDDDIAPEQAGLVRVWADDNNKLWKLVRKDGRMKLVRLWDI